jgi:hypothetical protein
VQTRNNPKKLLISKLNIELPLYPGSTLDPAPLMSAWPSGFPLSAPSRNVNRAAVPRRTGSFPLFSQPISTLSGWVVQFTLEPAVTRCGRLAFNKSVVTLSRRVAPGERIRGWGRPTVFHIDLRYQQEKLFALNFWTPFDPAGAAYRSPGIEIVDMGLKDVAKWLEFTPRGNEISGVFNADRFDFDGFVTIHGTDRISRPSLAPGDLSISERRELLLRPPSLDL